MTAHTCKVRDPNCYRCDLNLDEIGIAIEETVKRADALTEGDRFMVGDVEVLVLSEDPEPWVDLFGRDMVRVMARRNDTGDEGWVLFSPINRVVLLSTGIPS